MRIGARDQGSGRASLPALLLVLGVVGGAIGGLGNVLVMLVIGWSTSGFGPDLAYAVYITGFVLIVGAISGAVLGLTFAGGAVLVRALVTALTTNKLAELTAVAIGAAGSVLGILSVALPGNVLLIGVVGLVAAVAFCYVTYRFRRFYGPVGPRGLAPLEADA